MRLPILAFLIPALLFGQGWTNPKSDVAPNALDVNPGSQDWVCPMDADIRSDKPGKCPRCGMDLVKGIVERIEYPVRLDTHTKVLRAGVKTHLEFEVQDPKTLKTVKDFAVVHEKLFHLFVISQDLSFFMHEHPIRQSNSTFTFDMEFPKPGLYRVLSDFYPQSGTPQLVEKTLLVAGPGFKLEPAKITVDEAPQQGPNLNVQLTTGPARPISGQKTIIFVRLRPNDGIEPYLGTFAHMMAASSDLIDMIHAHPETAADLQAPDNSDDRYKELQFTVYFPRPGMYRVWIQFKRKGVVNTVAFNVPVLSVNEAMTE